VAIEAYDQSNCDDAIAARAAKTVILPRKDAVIWRHGNRKNPPHPRDEALRHIRRDGRKKWKRDHHYHCRSLAETTLCPTAYSSIAASTRKHGEPQITN
jgi:hypothetical protein